MFTESSIFRGPSLQISEPYSKCVVLHSLFIVRCQFLPFNIVHITLCNCKATRLDSVFFSMRDVSLSKLASYHLNCITMYRQGGRSSLGVKILMNRNCKFRKRKTTDVKWVYILLHKYSFCR